MLKAVKEIEVMNRADICSLMARLEALENVASHKKNKDIDDVMVR
jgi:hypothetical protein